MNDELWPIVSSAVTAAIGGGIALLTAYATNRANAVRERERHDRDMAKHREEMLRSRGEELYILFDQWSTDLQAHAYLHGSWISGRISRNEALEMVEKNIPPGRAIGRIELLTAAYFPTVKRYLAKFLKARDAANYIVGEQERRIRNSRVPEGSNSTFEDYQAACLDIDEAADAVKFAIVAELEKIQ
ncbi:hypothetical protein D9M68_582060 [compost metagenome]